MEEKMAPLKSDHKKSQQIEVRFKTSIALKRKVKTWTPQQDERLFQLHERFPKKWNKISEMMGNRNENQCLHRFRRLVQVGEHKKIWSAQEDQVVLQMVNRYGNNWKIIAAAIKTKTGKQIRERYINKLDPSIKRQQWSQAEDFKIIELYTKFGSKWSEISKGLSGRPQNKIKNRFYSYIQKNYDILIKDEATHTHELSRQHSAQNKPEFVCEKQSFSNFIYLPEKKTSHLESPLQNKENKERQNKQRMEKLLEKVQKPGSKKLMEEQWNRERSLQQINEPNQIAYNSTQGNEDFFYFQDN